MAAKFKDSILILSFFCSLSFFFNHVLLAQETVKIIKHDLSQGVTLELNTTAIRSSTNLIAISDSSNQSLALSNLALNDQNVWIKNSKEPVDSGRAHWYFDEDSQSLYIDLSGIKQSFSANTVLQLTILPVKTFETNLSLSLFESSSNSGSLPDGLQKISDVKVDLK